MKIKCSVCDGRGEVGVALHDMKKDDYGWFRKEVCPECHGTKYLTEIMLDESLLCEIENMVEDELNITRESIRKWPEHLQGSTNYSLKEILGRQAGDITRKIVLLLAKYKLE